MTLPRDAIKKEIADISFIYETMFPDTPVELHLWWENAQIPSPTVMDNDGAYGPEYAALGRLGTLSVGPKPCPESLGKRVVLTLPSPAQIKKRSNQAQAWISTKPLYWSTYKAAPVFAENVKYLIEQKHKRRQAQTLRYDRLAVAQNLNDSSSLAVSTRSPKPPAILIGVHWFDIGGAESLAIDSILWALEAGLRVFVIAELDGPERLVPRLPDHPNLSILRTNRYLPRHLVSNFIGKLVSQENIVLTHNHHCIPLYDALPTLKLLHPNLHHIDSTHIIEHSDGGFPRISGVWSNFIDVHHVISQELQTFYNKRFSVYGAKLRTGRLLNPNNRANPIPAARLSTGQKTCRVAFVGRMVHQKRPTLALKIMKKLARWGQRNGVKFQFDVVGTGPYRAIVEQQIARYRLQEHLQLHDAGIDVPALLGQSDVLLLPSSNEGLALVCYEAIEAGCIPISTRVGAQDELCPETTLVSPHPGQAIRQSVQIVTRLLRERGFAEAVSDAQVKKMQALRAEPTAQEVLGEIYRNAVAPDTTTPQYYPEIETR